MLVETEYKLLVDMIFVPFISIPGKHPQLKSNECDAFKYWVYLYQIFILYQAHVLLPSKLDNHQYQYYCYPALQSKDISIDPIICFVLR